MSSKSKPVDPKRSAAARKGVETRRRNLEAKQREGREARVRELLAKTTLPVAEPIRPPFAGEVNITLERVPVRDPAPAPAPKLSLWQQLRQFALNVPTQYTTILALICGALTVLNQTTFDLPSIVKTSVTWGLAVFAFMGVGPILGPKFRAALHLSAPVATVISIGLAVGLVVCQADLSLPYRAIVIGVIQVAGGLGFAPAYLPTVE